MNRQGAFETVVGVIVIAAAALFLKYAFDASGRGFAGGAYELQAVFGRVDGVAVGSEVRIAGVKVGAVSSSALDPLTYEARLGFLVDGAVPVPEDSIAKIVSDGLIGGAHVSIEPGASETMLARGGQILRTQGSVDLLGLAVRSFTADRSGGESEADAEQGDGLGSFDP